MYTDLAGAMKLKESKVRRRDFLKTSVLAGLATAGWAKTLRAALPLRRPEGMPKIAAIVTEWRSLSHADVIVRPLMQGYTLDGKQRVPKVKVVSMYTDQVPDTDLSRPMARYHGCTIYPRIDLALTLGGETLAVDGVLLIGEHGNYPYNEKGQHMYPRPRFFRETVKVFERSRQVVPVFNDKHLAYDWADAKAMYDKARALGVPFMAGSSLVTCWRRPELEFPIGAEITEAIVLAHGGVEAYGFHALETLQCMVERRKGGETGVRSVQLLEGDAVWRAGRDGAWSGRLFDAALDVLSKKNATGTPRKNCRTPEVFLIRYNDGLKAAVFVLSGHVRGWSFAASIQGRPTPAATEFWLQEPGYGHFNFLVENVSAMFLSGEPTYPVERTLLTTGILSRGMDSRFDKGRVILTPELAVAYRPGEKIPRRGGDGL